MSSPSAPGPSHDPERLLGLAKEQPQGSPGGFTPPNLEALAALLPGFEIHGLIGRGGMGAVYRARQRNLDRMVAIKILPPELAKDASFEHRFEREAKTLARLNHPNIVRLFDFGVSEGLHYLVLEHVDGTSLRELLRMGRLSPSEALRIVPRICSALEYAHRHGIVHRDIKPENILIDQDGDVRLADFGIARMAGGEATGFSLTESGQRLGTPHYMAPEQVESPASVDHRADLFAVGVVFYEMLTGRLPLGRFEPPSAASGVGRHVDDIVLRSLEREPARRYQEAQAMRSDVEAAWKEGFAAGTRAASPPTGPSRVPPSTLYTNDGPGVRPPSPRLCWLGVVGIAWFVLGIAGFLLSMVAVQVEPHMVGEPDREDPLFNRILGISVMVLSIASLVGGPVLGAIAERRIRNSEGRLYGLRAAILATWAPAIVIVDGVVMSVVINLCRRSDGSSVKWLPPLAFVVLLVLNVMFLRSRVAESRAASRSP